MHGKGTFSDTKGNAYDGDYWFEVKHGKGTQIFGDGSKYKGGFDDDYF